MKINITVEVPETSPEVKPAVEVKTIPEKKDYHQKPPFKGVMVCKAKRLKDKNRDDARIYQFRYNPKDYPEVNGRSTGIPLQCGYSSIRVNPNQFWPSSRGLLPFVISEHDNYCGPGGTCYPVLFEVFDFEWEEDNA